MTEIDVALTTPAWPICSVGAWAAAWRDGRVSADHVIDVVAEHSTRAEFVDHTGGLGGVPLGEPATVAAAILTALQGAQSFSVRLPGPGDLQGLPPDPVTTAAIGAGQVLLFDTDRAPGAVFGLVAERAGATCRWSLHRFATPVTLHHQADAGDIEYRLRAAVTESAEVIGELGSLRRDNAAADIRARLAPLIATHRVDLPPHERPRADRMVESAATVEAIVTLAGNHGAGLTAGQHDLADNRLRDLAIRARQARAAAINSVIDEFARARA